MKTILIGATGATGVALTNKLINAPEISEIITWDRRKTNQEHPKLTREIIDFDRMEDYADAIHADIAFSCLGTTHKAAGSKERQWKIDHDYQLKFAQLCFERGVSCFVLVSSLGANPDSKIFYSRMKGKLEEAIKGINFKKLLIFQPSLLIRPNTDRSGEKVSSQKLYLLSRLGLFKNYKPIKTETLAEALLHAALANSNGINTYSGKNIFDLMGTPKQINTDDTQTN